MGEPNIGKLKQNRRAKSAIQYACIRFFAFLVLAGAGMELMLRTGDYCYAIATGIWYLIIMFAVIVVILSDELEREILKRLHGSV